MNHLLELVEKALAAGHDAYTLTPDGFEKVPNPMPPAGPVGLRWPIAPRQEIAASFQGEFDAARAVRPDLSRANGWATLYEVHRSPEGFGILMIVVPDDGFIGPHMSVAASFMRNERQHLEHVRDLLAFEAMVLSATPAAAFAWVADVRVALQSEAP